MTDLQKAYVELRGTGLTHFKTIGLLARRYDMPEETVSRILHRADELDTKEHRCKGA
jgi:hypothetical protein